MTTPHRIYMKIRQHVIDSYQLMTNKKQQKLCLIASCLIGVGSIVPLGIPTILTGVGAVYVYDKYIR